MQRGSCALTHELVCALLDRDPAESVPSGVAQLLEEHAENTGLPHEFQDLCEAGHVQRLLSDEQHGALLKKIKVRSSARMKNLLLACTMPHASDWLHAPPIPGLGLSLKTDVFRTAVKFRLGMPLMEPV